MARTSGLHEYMVIANPRSQMPPPPGPRGGETFDPAEDMIRLNKQMDRVWHCVYRSGWWTYHGIHEKTGAPEASIGARLRDTRKVQFGCHMLLTRRAPDYDGPPVHWWLPGTVADCNAAVGAVFTRDIMEVTCRPCSLHMQLEYEKVIARIPPLRVVK